jgi:hypothetical protein
MALRLSAVTALLVLLGCGPSFAAVLEGASSDAVGDAGAPAHDIVSASATYDTAGVLTVTAEMNGELATRPQTHWSFDIARSATPYDCSFDPIFTMLFGLFSETRRGVGFIGDAPDLFDVPASLSGRTLTATWRAAELADRGYGCVSLTLGQDPGGDADYVFFDRLEPPIVFAGFGNRPGRTPARAVPAPCNRLLGRDRARCIKRRLALARCDRFDRPARRAKCRRRARRVRL